jgi:outer membrane immunogenic protein
MLCFAHHINMGRKYSNYTPNFFLPGGTMYARLRLMPATPQRRVLVLWISYTLPIVKGDKMKKTIIATALASAFLFAGTAMAQDTAQDAPMETAEVTAPDGSPAFGIEPYFGVQGAYESYDRNLGGNVNFPSNPANRYNGYAVEGVLGVNIPVGPIFVGAEGNVAKGIDGDFDWRYGVVGRAGFRAGDSGMIYGRAGYEWTNFRSSVAGNRDYGNKVYGIGVEVGPKDIGLGGITTNTGIRLRLEANTTEFESIRPTVGVIAHF